MTVERRVKRIHGADRQVVVVMVVRMRMVQRRCLQLMVAEQ